MSSSPARELTAEQERQRNAHPRLTSSTRRIRKLLAEIAKFQAVRQNRIREMVARLNALNVPLEADGGVRAGQLPLARPAARRPRPGEGGLLRNLDEAFERFLKKNRPAWVPKFKMSARDAIELIHQAGGLAVMAHPGLNRTDEVIPDLVAAGLDGIECFHTKHSHRDGGALPGNRRAQYRPARHRRLGLPRPEQGQTADRHRASCPIEHVEKLNAAKPAADRNAPWQR